MKLYRPLSIVLATCVIVFLTAGCGSHTDVQSAAPPGPANTASQQAGQQAAQRAAQQAAAMKAAGVAHPNKH